MAPPITLPPLLRGQWLPMTYEEFLAWKPGGLQGEWVDGKGIIFMPASDRHNWIIALLYDPIARFADLFGLGRVMLAPFEMRLSPDGPSREPDVLFLARDHLDRWTDTRIQGPADLVVEVISDDSVERDRQDKFHQYAATGIQEYVMVDPRLGQEWFGLYRLDAAATYHAVEPDEQGRYHSEVLPGFWLDPNWFWQDPLPRPEELLLQIAPAAYQRYLRRLLGESDPG